MRGMVDNNFPAFDTKRDALKRKGWDVVSPADLDREIGFDPSTVDVSDDFSQHAIRRDIEALLDCEAIYMMRDWEMSHGASIEHAIARGLGMRIFYEAPRDKKRFNYGWHSAIPR
jgi:hypothetical protein